MRKVRLHARVRYCEGFLREAAVYSSMYGREGLRSSGRYVSVFTFSKRSTVTHDQVVGFLAGAKNAVVAAIA
jgi:hypothetical protein